MLPLNPNLQNNPDLPNQIRVSLGTGIVLGLLEGKLKVAPTTAYLMTYQAGKCKANCSFCSQARASKSSTQLLSRVTWPTFPTNEALAALVSSVENLKIGRVCIQALNYSDVFGHLDALVKEIKKLSSVEVSISCQPQNRETIQRLKLAGVDRLGISLDGATREVFDLVKGVKVGGCYKWENQFQLLTDALTIFGTGNASTHVIVGLGESEKDLAEIIQKCVVLGVLPALFAFTPVRGTAMEANAPPKVEVYRRIQLARYLIVKSKTTVEQMGFDENGRIIHFGLSQESLEQIISGGLPFLTSGCPSCNRPYYNEKPSGPIYNYPTQPNKEEIEKIKKQLS